MTWHLVSLAISVGTEESRTPNRGDSLPKDLAHVVSIIGDEELMIGTGSSPTKRIKWRPTSPVRSWIKASPTRRPESSTARDTSLPQPNSHHHGRQKLGQVNGEASLLAASSLHPCKPPSCSQIEIP